MRGAFQLYVRIGIELCFTLLNLAVNLKYNSMGYEYEDFNNIQVSRPIIAKSMLN